MYIKRSQTERYLAATVILDLVSSLLLYIERETKLWVNDFSQVSIASHQATHIMLKYQ